MKKSEILTHLLIMFVHESAFFMIGYIVEISQIGALVIVSFLLKNWLD